MKDIKDITDEELDQLWRSEQLTYKVYTEEVKRRKALEQYNA